MNAKKEGPSEIQELKARVAELEDALKREKKSKKSTAAVGDSMRETANRAVDEYNKFFRSLTMSYLEGVRLAAETAASFARGISESGPSEKAAAGEPSVATVMDQTRDLATGCTSAYSDAVNELLDIPRQTIGKFYEGYRES